LKKIAQNSSPFIPIAKKIVETGRSSGSPGLLRLPGLTYQDSDFDSETFLWAYSCGYSSGISPDSLFDSPLRKRR